MTEKNETRPDARRRQKQEGGRKPLRAAVSEIDQEILRLLVRRSNLLNKMRASGKLPAADEKYLREAWQNDVARVSRDPELSGRFFSLLQKMTFLPRPSDDEGENLPGARRRQAFNLAPPNLPIHLSMTAPLSGWQTCAWLYLAAVCGQALRLSPCLQNDPLVDFVQGLAQIGAAITRDDEAIFTRDATPLPAPDKVVHAGESEFGLYLFIAHYLGRYSRVKLTGGSRLQLADYSAIRRFLPKLGARLISIVPKSDGLPARLEASGILPPGAEVDADLPAEFVEALILAAPGYETPFSVDLRAHPRRDSILSHTRPLLRESGAVFSLDGSTLATEPSRLVIPAKPLLAADDELAAFLLAFAPALGGEVKLGGELASWPDNREFWRMCLANGFRMVSGGIEAGFDKPAANFDAACFEPVSDWQTAFVAMRAACATLGGGNVVLPAAILADANVNDFLRAASLEVGRDGALEASQAPSGLAWNAPSPAWAMALAISACRRHGKAGWPLGNPGIVMELWPPFWACYNSLPEPKPKRREETKEDTAKARRRIITGAIAVPHEIREEDWN